MKFMWMFLACSNAFAGTLAIFEVGPGGASDLQRLSYLSLRDGNVSYVVCPKVSDDYELCARQADTTLPLDGFEEKITTALGLGDYYQVSRSYAQGLKNVQQYRDTLKQSADTLSADEARRVETDLEKAQVTLEASRAQMLKIQKENPAYKSYLQVSNPLKAAAEFEGAVHGTLYSSVNQQAVMAAFSVFQDYRGKHRLPVAKPVALKPTTGKQVAPAPEAPPGRTNRINLQFHQSARDFAWRTLGLDPATAEKFADDFGYYSDGDKRLERYAESYSYAWRTLGLDPAMSRQFALRFYPHSDGKERLTTFSEAYNYAWRTLGYDPQRAQAFAHYLAPLPDGKERLQIFANSYTYAWRNLGKDPQAAIKWAEAKMKE